MVLERGQHLLELHEEPFAGLVAVRIHVEEYPQTRDPLQTSPRGGFQTLPLGGVGGGTSGELEGGTSGEPEGGLVSERSSSTSRRFSSVAEGMAIAL